MKLPFANGTLGVAVTRRKDRSLMGRYWNAVHKYVATGDASALAPFADAHVLDARGHRVRLLTDVAILDRLAAAGVLSFEEIYGRRI